MCFEFEALYWAKLAEEEEMNRRAEELKQAQQQSTPPAREHAQDDPVPA